MTLQKYEFDNFAREVEKIPADSPYRAVADSLLKRLRETSADAWRKQERISQVENRAQAVADEAKRLHAYCRYYADRTALIRPLVDHILKMSLPEMQALNTAWATDPDRDGPEPDILERLNQTLAAIAEKE